MHLEGNEVWQSSDQSDIREKMEMILQKDLHVKIAPNQ